MPDLSSYRSTFPFAALLLLTACIAEQKPSVTEHQATVDFDLILNLPAEPIDYDAQVKPVLERRCVICHGCYDAPCQLKLSSREGLGRGANPDKVYNGARILAAEPTRLFVDARTDAEWRGKGFHPVLDESGATLPEDRLRNSVLYRLLRLKQRHPQPRVGMLPDDFDLELDREQTCPSLETVAEYEREHPLWGMPYAMPNLGDGEYRTLVQWLAQGAPGPRPLLPSPRAEAAIPKWEAFLNGDTPKRRLMSRYLFEHLFVAHIHFSGTPNREFYRLARSFTPPGQPLDEVPTVRPYDDPGPAPFYYRLVRYHPSAVAKDHVVYEFSPARMERYQALFLDADYEVDTLPGYDPEVASNPFKTFHAIPPVSRYRFLLDDARFFIEGFIKGPVCRGQVALNVIEDQFWVVFIDPDKADFGLDPDFLDANADYLRLPAADQSKLRPLKIWTEYAKLQHKFMLAKQAAFEQMHSLDVESALGYVWNGNGTNPNAALTVFRHFDSASVEFGLLGDYPETAWVIDYPLFERIHYLLVAGFNVYGNVSHQLNTRLYMEFLRMEGEDQFLAFLPADRRKAIRDSWYVGVREGIKENFDAPMDWLSVESVVGYRTDDPQRELYRLFEARLGPMAGPPDVLNRCPGEPCKAKGAGPTKVAADRAMRRVAAIRGETLEVFPDLALVRVKAERPEDDLSYTLVRNKAYLNITSIFEDEDRRDREHDTLTVLDRFTGSYPNFFFVVDAADIDAFADRYATIRDREGYERFVGLYGVRRTNESYWATADWFHDRYAREQPILSGLFDLNRYRNR